MLTDLHRRILDFEAQRWRFLGAKETAVRDRFGLSLVQYHQKLTWAIDQPEALAHAPTTVHRLRRIRDTRTAARTPAT